MLQDDSYIESYISTIGVDFVSTTLWIFSLNRLRQCLYWSFHVILCRKYVLLSRMGKPLNSRLYVYDWVCFSSVIFLYYVMFLDFSIDRFFLLCFVIWFYFCSGTQPDKNDLGQSPVATIVGHMGSLWVMVFFT